MFEKGKVYKTLSGKPAKILWVYTFRSGGSGLVVLHCPYTTEEKVLQHRVDGIFSEIFDYYNLTTEEY